MDKKSIFQGAALTTTIWGYASVTLNLSSSDLWNLFTIAFYLKCRSNNIPPCNKSNLYHHFNQPKIDQSETTCDRRQCILKFQQRNIYTWDDVNSSYQLALAIHNRQSTVFCFKQQPKIEGIIEVYLGLKK